MAIETLRPDAILAQTNLTGAVTDIDEDPDSADASWLTGSAASNVSTDVRVSFPSPSAGLTDGGGLQEFRVQVRKTNKSTNPTCSVELWENGSLVSTVIASTAVSSTTGTVLSGTWDSTGRNAANIECKVVGVVGGGSPSNRAVLEVGAIEWNATVTQTPGNATAGLASVAVSALAATAFETILVPVGLAAISVTALAATATGAAIATVEGDGSTTPVFNDSFTGANGTSLTTHAPDTIPSGGGATWSSAIADGDAQLKAGRASNAFVADSSFGNVYDVGVTDGEYSAIFSGASGQVDLFVAVATNTLNDGLIVRRTGDTWALVERISGIGTTLLSGSGLGSGDKTLKLAVDGSALELFIDTVSQGTASWTPTSNTLIGMLLYSTATTVYLDDLSVAQVVPGVMNHLTIEALPATASEVDDPSATANAGLVSVAVSAQASAATGAGSATAGLTSVSVTALAATATGAAAASTGTASAAVSVLAATAAGGTSIPGDATAGLATVSVATLTASASSRRLYSDLIRSDSPVAYWKADETSGSLVDVIGGKVLSVTGTPVRGVHGAITGDRVVYAQDGFGRTETDSLGPADIGGDYNEDGANTDVSGGVAILTTPTANSRATGVLDAVSAQDIDLTIRFKADKLPDADSWVQFFGRLQHVPDNDYDIFGVVNGTSVGIFFGKNDNGSFTGFGSTIPVTRETFATDTWFNLRAQIVGEEQVTLRAKVWQDGTDQPVLWDAEYTDTTPGSVIQNAGIVGFRAEVGAITNAPIVWTVDDFAVTEAPAPAVATTADGNYFETPDHADFDFGNGPFSLDFWARRITITGSTHAILLSKKSQGNVFFLNDKLCFDNDATIIVQESGTTTDTEWHHWAITRNGTGSGNTRLYKDGVDVTSDGIGIGNSTTANATNLRIGEYADGTLNMKAAIDEVALFDTVLSAAQVIAHATFPNVASTAMPGLATISSSPLSASASGAASAVGGLQPVAVSALAPSASGAATAGASLLPASLSVLATDVTGAAVAAASLAVVSVSALHANVSGGAAIPGTASPGLASVALSPITATTSAGATIQVSTPSLSVQTLSVAPAGAGAATAGLASAAISGLSATATAGATPSAALAAVAVSALPAVAMGGGAAVAQPGIAVAAISALAAGATGAASTTAALGSLSVTALSATASGGSAIPGTANANLLTVSVSNLSASAKGAGRATCGLSAVTITPLSATAVGAAIASATTGAVGVSPLTPSGHGAGSTSAGLASLNISPLSASASGQASAAAGLPTLGVIVLGATASCPASAPGGLPVIAISVLPIAAAGITTALRARGSVGPTLSGSTLPTLTLNGTAEVIAALLGRTSSGPTLGGSTDPEPTLTGTTGVTETP